MMGVRNMSAHNAHACECTCSLQDVNCQKKKVGKNIFKYAVVAQLLFKKESLIDLYINAYSYARKYDSTQTKMNTKNTNMSQSNITPFTNNSYI